MEARPGNLLLTLRRVKRGLKPPKGQEMSEAEPAIAKAQADRRRYRRVRVNLQGRLFVPADERETRCKVVDLSPGGAAIECDVAPDNGTPVVLYVDGFGRFEGAVARRDGFGFGVKFVCTASKRERTAEQLMLFLNKSLVDDSVLRRHERAPLKGFARFTRADGEIVKCEVLDISTSGVSLKTDTRPPIGEFVLIAQMAGRIARHHDQGIGIEYVGQDSKPAERPLSRVNLVR